MVLMSVISVVLLLHILKRRHGGVGSRQNCIRTKGTPSAAAISRRLVTVMLILMMIMVEMIVIIMKMMVEMIQLTVSIGRRCSTNTTMRHPTVMMMLIIENNTVTVS